MLLFNPDDGDEQESDNDEAVTNNLKQKKSKKNAGKNKKSAKCSQHETSHAFVTVNCHHECLLITLFIYTTVEQSVNPTKAFRQNSNAQRQESSSKSKGKFAIGNYCRNV